MATKRKILTIICDCRTEKCSISLSGRCVFDFEEPDKDILDSDFQNEVDGSLVRKRTHNPCTARIDAQSTARNTTKNRKCFGNDALNNATSGRANACFGRGAGHKITTGNKNTFIGGSDLEGDGGGSTHVGAGCRTTTGSSNVAVGSASFLTNLVGYCNTIVGDSADVSADGLKNASAFGYKAKVGFSNSFQFGDNNVNLWKFGTGNYITLSKDSALRMKGTATVWEDLMFPFSRGKQGNADYPPFVIDSLYFAFSIDSVGNDANIMCFVIQLPHKWKEGSTIFPHVHYKHESAVGTPTFKMKYKWYNIGASTAVGWNWYTMGTTTGTIDKTHQMVSGAAGISGSGKTISSILVCYIYLTAATGTPPVNAWQMDIHYEADALGSNTETSKN